MNPQLATALMLVSGVFWTIAYAFIVVRSLRDRTCGMPLFALVFNLSWEFIFAFLIRYPESHPAQPVINGGMWFVFDLAILYTYLKFGKKEFPADEKWFLPWTGLALGIAFFTVYAAGKGFDGMWGSIYSAFAQNLLMSILFVAMLVRRGNVDGQSMIVAVSKWIGTAAPTAYFWLQTGSTFVLVLGIGCFLYDVIYIAMLYAKFRELGLHPLTRRKVG